MPEDLPEGLHLAVVVVADLEVLAQVGLVVVVAVALVERLDLLYQALRAQQEVLLALPAGLLELSVHLQPRTKMKALTKTTTKPVLKAHEILTRKRMNGSLNKMVSVFLFPDILLDNKGHAR